MGHELGGNPGEVAHWVHGVDLAFAVPVAGGLDLLAVAGVVGVGAGGGDGAGAQDRFQEPLQAAAWHDGIGVEEEDDVSFSPFEALVAGFSKSAVRLVADGVEVWM